MFVGRKRELGKLEAMYLHDQFECAVFYGRRRVGKTTLIDHFCQGKKPSISPLQKEPQKIIWQRCPGPF